MRDLIVRLLNVYDDFAAHVTWHMTQPDMYFETVAECPGDFIECPWCHRRFEC